MRGRLSSVGHLILLSIVLASALIAAAIWDPEAREHEAAAGPMLEEAIPAAAGHQEGDPVPAEDAASTAAPESEAEPVPARRVGIQAGHWKTAEMPDELARLRTATGTSGGGVAEWKLNLDIALRVAALLEDEGIVADVLPATVPPGYQADAFVALHADGDVSGRFSGFKLARATRSRIPEVDDALLAAISEQYAAATNLPEDWRISRNMTGYYAFSGWRLKHAIAPTTPAVILEMGFLTNASDRKTLLGAQDKVAAGVAAGILRFLESRNAQSG